MTLENLALRWLRFEKGCPVALFERSPRYGIGQPDVLGITKARYMLEIEIKRSVSDFRANFKKRHIQYREARFDPNGYHVKRVPKQFWFLVPPELVKKVEPLVPAWAGLMRGPGRNEPQGPVVVKPAPSNELSTRLNTKEMVTLGHCMANQILSLAQQNDNWRNREYEPWHWFYQI